MDITAEQVRVRLETLMTGLKLSQREFAKVIGISPAHLGDVLCGNREPAGRILEYLKLERVVLYRSIERDIRLSAGRKAK